MCLCSSFNRKSLRLFKERHNKLSDPELYEDDRIRALGTVADKCSIFFTADFEAIYTDQGLAYAITQYDSEEVILVRDDDYTDLELPEWCSSDLLPLDSERQLRSPRFCMLTMSIITELKNAETM